MYFVDRIDAGKKLASVLERYHNNTSCVILGLPRGGVVVAAEVARALRLTLDIVVPRKIGAPGNPEYAIGAITETGDRVMNDDVMIEEQYVESEAIKEQKEAQRRLMLYRGNRPPLDLHGKTVILVDDGIATGLTMEAAIQSVRKRDAKTVIVAVPVAASDSIERLRSLADQIVCLQTPLSFHAVGQFYENFEQTTDAEVIALLQ